MSIGETDDAATQLVGAANGRCHGRPALPELKGTLVEHGAVAFQLKLAAGDLPTSYIDEEKQKDAEDLDYARDLSSHPLASLNSKPRILYNPLILDHVLYTITTY